MPIGMIDCGEPPAETPKHAPKKRHSVGALVAFAIAARTKANNIAMKLAMSVPMITVFARFGLDFLSGGTAASNT